MIRRLVGGLLALLVAVTPGSVRAALKTAARSASFHVGQTTPGERIRFLRHTVDRYRNLSVINRVEVELRHAEEDARLQKELEESKDEGVRLALAQSIASRRQAFAEVSRTYRNLQRFSESMESVLQSPASRGMACDEQVCGSHASCTDTTAGAQCVCDEGYVGSAGVDCHAPAEFAPRRLLFEGKVGVATFAADMAICVFETNKIAVVFRDMSKGGIGRVIVGSVREAGMADLSPPEQFTAPGGKAFSPVVQGSKDRRLLFAWRDQEDQGTGWVRGASMGTTGVRGADMALTWGAPQSFATKQGQKMALVTLPSNRFALMYVDRKPNSDSLVGMALLIQVDGLGGAASIRSKFRFSDFAVTRLEAVRVSETAFVLAARGAKLVDDLDPNVTTSQEAVAIYGEAVRDTLVFDSTPANFEPAASEIWARGVSLIAPNQFAYAYQSGIGRNIKMAVGEIDSITHNMRVAQEPVEIKKGFSEYVKMLSVPYTPSDPHTLIYYDNGNSSVVNICSWKVATKKIERCEDFTWMREKLSSVAGVHLGGGKAFMAFASEDGTPYYSVFGLSKK